MFDAVKPLLERGSAVPLLRVATLIAIAGVIAIAAATPAAAQELTIDFGDDESLSVRIVQMFLLVTVLSLAPAIAVMVTCFPFMVTVLSILRTAVGLQQAPPNMMIVSLALFLTYFVMEPVFAASWAQGVQPLLDGAIEQDAAFPLIMEPFRIFMTARVDTDVIATLVDALPNRPALEDGETPLSVLVPSFMLTELQRAFEIGFMIFLPFLVIDLVVASVLMAMGMMMVPPVVVSLPFKLAFFVMADGWALLAGALVTGYAQ